jgi:glycosyltransferase involved in cell wall biosynthesis
MVSHDYFNEESSADRVPEIIKTRLNTTIKPPLDPSFTRRLFEHGAGAEALQYLLIVSTIEPRKNHLTLLSAWERLRVEKFPALKLLVVGETGWRHKPILRLLYKHARATVCPSFGEGFDFSGVEAMKSGGAVIASDIPVHREVYGDAAEFFNPYSVEGAAQAIENVIAVRHAARREELISRGAVIARRYDHEVILPQWETFLRSLGS